MKNVIITISMLSLLVLLSGCDQQREHSSYNSNESQFTVQESGTTDSKMPSFELVSAATGQTRNSSEFEGQVLLITFFESSCGACREEIDGLKQIQEKFSTQGFSVVALSVPQDDPLTLKKISDKADINYPILIGNKGITEQFGGLSIVPASFLVDRSGYIVKKYLNHLDLHVVEQEIEILLSATGKNQEIQR